MRSAKSLAIGAVCAGLIACGSTLIWQSDYQVDQPALGYSLALDSDGNSYVGGAARFDAPDSYLPVYNGLLLKYGQSGELLWEAQLASSSFITNIHALPNGNLLVATQAEIAFGFMNDSGKTNDLWLVSGEDGSIINHLDTFEDESLAEVITTESTAYVLSTVPVTLDLCLFGCGIPDYHSTLTAYDFNGNIINELVFDSDPTVDMTLSGEGDLILAHSGQAIDKYQADLSLVWSINKNIEPRLSECNSSFINLSATSDGDIWLVCTYEALKLNAGGDVETVTDLSGYLSERSDSEGDVISGDFWGNSYTDVDAQGNLYIARSRNTAYANTQAGGLDGLYITDASTLESDVVLLKIAEDTGEVAWADDVNTAMYGANTSLVTYFYYPLAMDVIDQDVYLTFRGFKGRYSGYSDTAPTCNTVSDWLFPFNTCELDEALDAYAKTLRYNSQTGSRINNTRHEIAYPRAVQYSDAGEITIVGDNNPDIIYSQSLGEFFARGMSGTREPDSYASQSAITTEKRRF